MKVMQEKDIPAFVHAITNTGCDITAVGEHLYVIGDSDLPEDQADAARPVLVNLDRNFGRRDHLRREIAAYLRSIGRFIDIGRVD
ncbi:hypothetical protein [Bosea sp. Root483D1]|uniref:hypothetical protein n=1 Tax=Bosea sp. Root483D1 TaxID=1736544 RepID=UPI000B11EBE2|nr:hypothetical protein [Bosea sp. Root483D1]